MWFDFQCKVLLTLDVQLEAENEAEARTAGLKECRAHGHVTDWSAWPREKRAHPPTEVVAGKEAQ